MPKPVADHSAATCTFTYRDGRRCRSLRGLRAEYCFYHQRMQRRLIEADCSAAKVAEPLDSTFVSSSSLNVALTRLFAAIADGLVTPKTADQLINLAKLLYKTIPSANQEFLTAFNDPKAWRRLIRNMYDPQRYPNPGPIGAYDPTDPECTNSNNTNTNNQPKKSSLPETGQEFATEVLQKVIFS